MPNQITNTIDDSVALQSPALAASSGVTTTTPTIILSPRGITDFPDSLLAAGEVLTDDALVKISENAKAAGPRKEYIFMGYWKHGDTVPTPYSPIDNYAYDQTEITYDTEMYATRAPLTGFVSGQSTAPSIAGSQPANIYWFTCDADDSTGIISIQVSYFSRGHVAETITHDGIVKIYARCLRQSVSVQS